MDLLDQTLNALDIKVSPTFDMIAQHMPPSMYMVDTHAPGTIQQGNINLYTRPQVKMPDGTTATVRSMNFDMIDKNGKTVQVLVPTIGPNGEVWSNDEAIQNYRKAGETLGVFDSRENAENYAQALHEQQAKLYVDTGDDSDGSTK